MIAGVPVLNYQLAFGGRGLRAAAASASAVEEEDWILAVEPKTENSKIDGLCKRSKQACQLSGHPGEGGVPFLTLRGTERDLEAVLAESSGAVKFVEPDVRTQMIPDDEDDDAAAAGIGGAKMEEMPWGLARVGAPLRARAGRGVHIFVLDTGVRTTHVDFGGRAVATLDMTSGSAVECATAEDPLCAKDAKGHGTHCAGTAGGASYGVAPQTILHSMKTLGDDGSGKLSWISAALDWVATKRGAEYAAVASLSLGAWGVKSSMKTAVDAAVEAGVTVVVAAGNSNNDACLYSPAFVPSVITVGSTTSTDERSSFSNYGSCVDIWAPGSDVISAGVDSDTASSSKSGTSMACPHVAGGAALLLEEDPTRSPASVLQVLLEGAVEDAISGQIYGDVNRLLYVGAGGPPPTPAPAEPTEPPPVARCPEETSSGPRSNGDCKCDFRLECFQGGVKNCPYSRTARYGWRHSRYFLPYCTDCVCVPK